MALRPPTGTTETTETPPAAPPAPEIAPLVPTPELPSEHPAEIQRLDLQRLLHPLEVQWRPIARQRGRQYPGDLGNSAVDLCGVIGGQSELPVQLVFLALFPCQTTLFGLLTSLAIQFLLLPAAPLGVVLLPRRPPRCPCHTHSPERFRI